MKKQDVGRPSQLDDEQFLLKIRELVLQGTSELEMQKILDIPSGTWDYWKWKNYQGFADKLMTYKHERKLVLADMVSDEVLTAQAVFDDKIDVQLLGQKLKESQFIRETLGKDKGYSKRIEQTGKDGEALRIVFDDSFKDK